MSATTTLALLSALLPGGVTGWLIAAWAHRRSAELQQAYEHQAADEDMYIALAMLRRSRQNATARDDQTNCGETPGACCNHEPR